MNNIIINGEPVIARGGETILEAARKVGVHIPTLCYLRERSGVASCRVCVVEVEGEPHPVPACATPVRDGMEITTDSPKLAAYRKLALELILSSKGAALAAAARETGEGANELARLCAELGVEPPAAVDGADELPTVEGNPFLSYDPNLCIECQRCVGACNAAARNHSLQSRMRGSHVLIDAPFGPDWRATDCESCGNCAQACPTGALSLKRSRDAAARSADEHDPPSRQRQRHPVRISRRDDGDAHAARRGKRGAVTYPVAPLESAHAQHPRGHGRDGTKPGQVAAAVEREPDPDSVAAKPDAAADRAARRRVDKAEVHPARLQLLDDIAKDVALPPRERVVVGARIVRVYPLDGDAAEGRDKPDRLGVGRKAEAVHTAVDGDVHRDPPPGCRRQAVETCRLGKRRDGERRAVKQSRGAEFILAQCAHDQHGQANFCIEEPLRLACGRDRKHRRLTFERPRASHKSVAVCVRLDDRDHLSSSRRAPDRARVVRKRGDVRRPLRPQIPHMSYYARLRLKLTNAERPFGRSASLGRIIVSPYSAKTRRTSLQVAPSSLRRSNLCRLRP